MKLSLNQTAHLLKAHYRGDPDLVFSGVSTDTRNLTSGNLFIPLKGLNFNGHDFFPDALQKGAKLVLCEVWPENKNIPAIKVDNCESALRILASHFRDSLPGYFIAVTGSNGKTTTKSLLGNILGLQTPTFVSPGNLNNHLGLPLSILKADPAHSFGVFEMGMNNFGEINLLKEIARPHAAIITNIGESHLEKLGSREGVARGKKELLLPPHPPMEVYLPKDDLFFDYLKKDIPGQVISFGEHLDSDVRLVNANYRANKSDFVVKHKGRYYPFEIFSPSPILVKNTLPVIAFCLNHRIPVNLVRSGLKNFKLEAGRGETLKFDGGRFVLIRDYYNSNPSSVRGTLGQLDFYRDFHKIFIMGDMLELGDFSISAHREVGRFLAQTAIDTLFTFGKDSEISLSAFQNSRGKTETDHPSSHFTEINPLFEAVKNLSHGIDKGKLILIKGSRGMHLERVDSLIREFLTQLADK